MKIFAAALLAIVSQAISLKEEGGEMKPKKAAPSEEEIDAHIDMLLETPPTCPPKPSEEEVEAGKEDPEAVFDLIDQDGSGEIDDKEGFDALYCAVEYGMIDEGTARDAFKFLAVYAGDDEKLDIDEAAAALKALSSGSEEEGSGSGSEEEGEGEGPKPKKGGEFAQKKGGEFAQKKGGEFAQKKGGE